MSQSEKKRETSHRLIPALSLACAVLFGPFFSACSESAGEQGEACYVDEDCAEPWECDLHGKEVGTCQEPHAH